MRLHRSTQNSHANTAEIRKFQVQDKVAVAPYEVDTCQLLVIMRYDFIQLQVPLYSYRRTHVPLGRKDTALDRHTCFGLTVESLTCSFLYS